MPRRRTRTIRKKQVRRRVNRGRRATIMRNTAGVDLRAYNPKIQHSVTTIARYTTLQQINAGHANNVYDSSDGTTAWTLNAPWTIIDCGAATGTYYAGIGVRFTLETLPGFAEIQTLWDQYRIMGVKFWLWPLATSTLQQTSTAGTASWGVLVHSATDYDDNTAPAASEAGVLAMMERGSYQIYNMNNEQGLPMVRRLAVESPGVAFDETGTAAASALKHGQWLNLQDATVPHFGFKAIFEVQKPSGTVVPSISFRWVFQYLLQVKDQQ